jgi:hypothetical protein
MGGGDSVTGVTGEDLHPGGGGDGELRGKVATIGSGAQPAMTCTGAEPARTTVAAAAARTAAITADRRQLAGTPRPRRAGRESLGFGAD